MIELSECIDGDLSAPPRGTFNDWLVKAALVEENQRLAARGETALSEAEFRECLRRGYDQAPKYPSRADDFVEHLDRLDIILWADVDSDTANAAVLDALSILDEGCRNGVFNLLFMIGNHQRATEGLARVSIEEFRLFAGRALVQRQLGLRLPSSSPARN